MIDKDRVMAAVNNLMSTFDDASYEYEVRVWMIYVPERMDEVYGEDVLRPLASDLADRLEQGSW